VRSATRCGSSPNGRVRFIEAKVEFPNPTEDALPQPYRHDHAKERHRGGSTTLPPALRSFCRSGVLCRLPPAAYQVLVDGAHAHGKLISTDRDRRRLVRRQLPQVALRPERLCVPACEPSRTGWPASATISHGYGQGFLAEFYWTGTTDPSRFLAVTAAIEFHHPSRLALAERNRTLPPGVGSIAQRLNTRVGATGSVAGAMATIRLPVVIEPGHALVIRQR